MDVDENDDGTFEEGGVYGNGQQRPIIHDDGAGPGYNVQDGGNNEDMQDETE